MRRSLVVAVMAIMPMVGLANQNSRPDIQVNVPPEVFSTRGQSSQPCIQCCVYQDQNYSEGAVIKWKASCSSASVTKKPSARIR